MASMIFYEKDHAEKLLKTGFTSFMNYTDLSILAKYFRYIGENRTQIKKNLLEFCEKFTPNFNEILSRKKIDDAIKISDEYGIRLPIDVIVTNEELDVIKNCGDYKRQKVLFVMLVMAKYFKHNDTRLTPRENNKYSDQFYVNDTFINILKIAKVNVSRVERMNILNDIEQGGFITTIIPKKNKKKKNDISFKINFVCENSDGSIIITDMNNMIDFYPFYCEKCGKEIGKSKRHNLCPQCYDEHRKEVFRLSKRKIRSNVHR